MLRRRADQRLFARSRAKGEVGPDKNEVGPGKNKAQGTSTTIPHFPERDIRSGTWGLAFRKI